MLLPLQNFLLLQKLLLLFLQLLTLLLQTIFYLPQLLLRFPDPLFVLLNLRLPPCFFLGCLVPLCFRIIQLPVYFFQIQIQKSVSLCFRKLFSLFQRVQPVGAFFLALFCFFYFLLLLFQLLLHAGNFLSFRHICLRLFCKHVLIVPCILIPNNLHVIKCTVQHFQAVLNLIHFFHGIDHRTQILIRQCLQRIIQNLIYLCRFEFLGKLRRPHLYQQPDKLFVLLCLAESENMLVYQLFILALAVSKEIFLSKYRFHFALIKRNPAGADFFVQMQICSDPASVQ